VTAIFENDYYLDRPLWGSKAIAAEISRTEKQVFHMLEAGHLPAQKIGRLWVTTRRQLRAAISGGAAG
jgi:hypothetical protein